MTEPATPRQNALPPGSRIDRFRVDRVLGTGSFGITYEAWDTQLERRVALKEYFPQEAARRDLDSFTVHASEADTAGLFAHGLSRFLDEARTLARFRHPNIVGVQQYVEANGTACLVMDFEEGRPLSTRITQDGRLAEGEVRALVVPLLEGLRAVHAEGVLHRDIKPANVLIRADGTPVLLDFGAARQLAPDKHMTIVLTPKYAPIEQYASDQAQGPWTDLYALGATLFHAITGKAPMLATERLIARPGGDTVDVQLEFLAEQFSAQFLGTLAAMLRPDPDHRPRDADAVLAMLAGDLAIPASPVAGSFGSFTGDDAATVVNAPSDRSGGSTMGATIGSEIGTGALTQAQRAAAGLTAAPPGAHTATAGDGTAGAKVFPPPEPTPAPGAGRAGRIAAAAAAVVAVIGGAAWWLSMDTPSGTARAPLADTPEATEAAGPVRFRDAVRPGLDGPELVVVPAGDFLRGSPENEYGRDDDEGPRTLVRIATPFALGATEVTVAQYAAFVDATGYVTEAEADATLGCRTWDGGWAWQAGASWRDPGYPQSDEHPAVCLSWHDARAYTRWLTEQTGQRYGLPSEAQWEYATRAGNTAPHFWGNARACEFANVSDTTRARAIGLAISPENVFVCDDAVVNAAPSASYAANDFGLHDTLGNVWEWTRDCWAPDYLDAPVDGSAAEAGGCPSRTYRGGSWVNLPRLVRSASRGAEEPSMRYFNTGFRVHRTLQAGDPGHAAAGV